MSICCHYYLISFVEGLYILLNLIRIQISVCICDLQTRMIKYKNIYIFLCILMNKVIAIKTGHKKKVGKLPDEKMLLFFFQISFSNKKTSIFLACMYT